MSNMSNMSKSTAPVVITAPTSKFVSHIVNKVNI